MVVRRRRCSPGFSSVTIRDPHRVHGRIGRAIQTLLIDEG